MWMLEHQSFPELYASPQQSCQSHDSTCCTFPPLWICATFCIFFHLVNTEAVVKANTVPVGVQRELLLTSVEIKNETCKNLDNEEKLDSGHKKLMDESKRKHLVQFNPSSLSCPTPVSHSFVCSRGNVRTRRSGE